MTPTLLDESLQKLRPQLSQASSLETKAFPSKKKKKTWNKGISIMHYAIITCHFARRIIETGAKKCFFIATKDFEQLEQLINSRQFYKWVQPNQHMNIFKSFRALAQNKIKFISCRAGIVLFVTLQVKNQPSKEWTTTSMSHHPETLIAWHLSKIMETY